MRILSVESIKRTADTEAEERESRLSVASSSASCTEETQEEDTSLTEDAEGQEGEEEQVCQRLIQLSFSKIVNSRNERGGAKLHKNLLVLHLLQKARTENTNRSRDNSPPLEETDGEGEDRGTTSSDERQHTSDGVIDIEDVEVDDDDTVLTPSLLSPAASLYDGNEPSDPDSVVSCDGNEPSDRDEERDSMLWTTPAAASPPGPAQLRQTESEDRSDLLLPPTFYAEHLAEDSVDLGTDECSKLVGECSPELSLAAAVSTNERLGLPPSSKSTSDDDYSGDSSSSDCSSDDDGLPSSPASDDSGDGSSADLSLDASPSSICALPRNGGVLPPPDLPLPAPLDQGVNGAGAGKIKRQRRKRKRVVSQSSSIVDSGSGPSSCTATKKKCCLVVVDDDHDQLLTHASALATSVSATTAVTDDSVERNASASSVDDGVCGLISAFNSVVCACDETPSASATDREATTPQLTTSPHRSFSCPSFLELSCPS